jgi:hypothetical protein
MLCWLSIPRDPMRHSVFEKGAQARQSGEAAPLVGARNLLGGSPD